jgi:hypothetical protein
VLNINYMIQHRENIKKISMRNVLQSYSHVSTDYYRTATSSASLFVVFYFSFSTARRIARRCMEGMNCRRLLLRPVNVCKNIHACEQRVELQCNDPRKRSDAIS